MKIALVQYSPAWENANNSIEKLEKLFAERPLADLYIFPELTLTGFTMASDKFSEEVDGISQKFFINLAQKLTRDIIFGFIEKDGNKVYNTAIHLDRFGIINARYRKIHPFSFAGENKFYSAGDEPVVTKIKNVSAGLSICYDLRFPELYRMYGKAKTQIIVNIANWPVKRVEQWKKLLSARAIENQCYMIGVNRTGKDPFNEYNGCSAIFDPLGEEVVLTNADEQIAIADIDLNYVDTIREKLPFLQDMRLI